MAVAYLDPLAELQNEVERMLGGSADAGVFPPVNVFDAGEEFVVRAELPGVKPDKVELDVKDDTVTIRGERAFDAPDREGAYHRRERPHGRFGRVVRMPDRLETEGARAEYQQGVLTIHVPKARERRPRRVPIQGAS